jgi:hypothetical protein
VLAYIAAQVRDRKKSIVISPVAREAVRRMDDIFALEREINCFVPDSPATTTSPKR